ncbi:MAG: hypothetical protein AAB372_01710 [Patescibacteria group bacterium]
MDEEYEFAADLHSSRLLDAERLKHLVVDAAERVARKLNELIAQGHDTTAFSIALFLALLKDVVLDFLLDFTGIGLIPVLGQLPGLFVSAALMYFLWGKGWFLAPRVRIIWWIFGFFFDNLPLFEELPITIIVVLYAWHIVRKRAEKAQAQLENLNSLTERELEEIEDELVIA